MQVVQVCAEHKKVAKLLKHLKSVNEAAAGGRTLPRVLIFCNTIKVRASAALSVAASIPVLREARAVLGGWRGAFYTGLTQTV